MDIIYHLIIFQHAPVSFDGLSCQTSDRVSDLVRVKRVQTPKQSVLCKFGNYIRDFGCSATRERTPCDSVVQAASWPFTTAYLCHDGGHLTRRKSVCILRHVCKNLHILIHSKPYTCSGQIRLNANAIMYQALTTKPNITTYFLFTGTSLNMNLACIALNSYR